MREGVAIDVSDSETSAVFDISIDEALVKEDGRLSIRLNYTLGDGQEEGFYIYTELDSDIRLDNLRLGKALLEVRYTDGQYINVLAHMKEHFITIKEDSENIISLELVAVEKP